MIVSINKNFLQNQQCMLCSKSEFEFVHSLRDDDSRSAYRCMNCEHIQVIPLPTVEEDAEYYASDKMYKNIFKGNSIMQKEENLMERYRTYVEDELRKFATFIKRGERILDIGTGYGWLVELLRNDGYQVDGVEISEEKRILCRRRCGIEIYDWNLMGDSSEMRSKQGYYDIVCLQQTLEHISDPVSFLLRVSDLIKPDGRIFVSVPNQNDILKTIEPIYEKYHYLRPHLSYFTSQTLSLLLCNCGFKNIEVYGHQVYSIENHIWWLRQKQPYLNAHLINLPEPLEWINKIYKNQLESELISNVIIGIGYKKG